MEKLYYTIGEVARMFKVNTSLIRFWADQFEVIKPARNKKGNRLFSAQDLDYFRQIYQYVKEEGYTLQGAKEKLRKTPVEGKEAEVRKRLFNIRDYLLELKSLLDEE